MRKIKILVFALGLLLVWTLTPAFGLQIETSAEWTYSGMAAFADPSDSDTDVGSTGTVSSSVDYISGERYRSASASGNESGYIAADASYFYGEGNFNNNTASSSVTWAENYIVQSAGNYSLDFITPDGQLTIAGNDTMAEMTAGYEISIVINGSTEWESAFQVTGNQGAATTMSGVVLPSTYFYDGTTDIFGYDFNPFTYSLDLGAFQASDSLNVVYTLSVFAEGDGYETGAAAQFGVPTDLSTGAMYAELSYDVTESVPEPATMFLLGFGLIGLAGLRRKLQA